MENMMQHNILQFGVTNWQNEKFYEYSWAHKTAVDSVCEK